jgi:hypothetical protein
MRFFTENFRLLKKTVFAGLPFLALILMSTGCKSLFPSEDARTMNSWTNFDSTQITFDRIVPHQTTIEDLKKMGLEPHSSPNIKLLTYLDVITRFLPNQSITLNDVPPDIRSCIESRDCCQAYELNLVMTRSKREGNLVLDVFNFKKKTHITGWTFTGLIIIKDGMVTYKLISGEPSVNRMEKKLRPLGPLQELDGMLNRVPGMM